MEGIAHVSQGHGWGSDRAVIIVMTVVEPGEYDVINDNNIPGIIVM